MIMMKKNRIGILLLHGFTTTPTTFRFFIPKIEALGIPYQAPILYGHGAESPLALKGVYWKEWIAQAVHELNILSARVEKIIIIGHSMGGMIALHLAASHEKKIDSVIVAGSSPRSISIFGPGHVLNFLVPYFVKVVNKLDWHHAYSAPEYPRGEDAYKWVPTDALLQLFAIMKSTGRILRNVKLPVLILHSKVDSKNSPDGAIAMFEKLSTPKEEKKLVWFEQTDHSMFLDCEKEAVNQIVVEYVKNRMSGSEVKPAHQAG
jgi:carboxylesterase